MVTRPLLGDFSETNPSGDFATLRSPVPSKPGAHVVERACVDDITGAHPGTPGNLHSPPQT